MIPFNKDLFCDPVSNTGTLSQLYTQLMVPRGFTITTSETKNKKSRSPSPIDADSDSGVVFKLGLYSQEHSHSDSQGTEDVLGTSCSLLHRRTSTMPDLNIIPCIWFIHTCEMLWNCYTTIITKFCENLYISVLVST
jgi:hypothetical protein